MIEWRQDFTFLRQFVREGDQSAFAALMRRHLDLVFATALGKVGDQEAAQEVAQNVFLALARKAWRFSPEDSLPAWLHRTTLLESRQWLRGELRRRRREQTAAELGTTMKTPEEQPALRALLPLLDEALLSLREKDRTALLLRFYERRSLREVGAALGVNEDTAQKRVATSIERLTLFFQRRGFRTAGTAAAMGALQHAAQGASAATAASLVQTVLHSAPPAVTGLTALFARLAALPKAQTTALCLILAAAPASIEWKKTSISRDKAATALFDVAAARAEHEQLMAQSQRLRNKLRDLENLAAHPPALATSQTEEAMRSFASLKTRLSELFSASDYRWPEDLPFVRVPKTALKSISSDVPAFGPKGRLSQWIKEVLNLSSQQQTALVASLAQHLEAMDHLAAANATSTNWVANDGTYHNQVKVPALGDLGQTLENNLSTNLSTLLGPDQSQLVLSPFSSPNQWLSEEKVSHFLINEPGEFELQVKPNTTSSPVVSLSWQYHLSRGGPVVQESMPTFLQNFFVPWLERNGLINGVLISEP